MADIIEISIDNPYMSRLEALSGKFDTFQDAQYPFPNLVGEMAIGLTTVLFQAAVFGSAVVHGAVHIENHTTK